MNEYTKKTYTEKFGEKMWQDKVEATLSDREKELGVESVYATEGGNIFMVMLNEGSRE